MNSFIYTIVLFVAIFSTLIFTFKIVNRSNPTPIVDEAFHIPQAQRYCRYDFDKWDSKITTPPGLYLVSVAILKPIEYFVGISLCSQAGLRFTNVLGTVFIFSILFLLRTKIHRPNHIGFIDVLSSFNVTIFPPLFFFSFLYYTEVWSTAFVLLMYGFHGLKLYFPAAIVGVASVMMRQTNIIWVGLMLMDATWSAIAGEEKKNASNLFAILRLIQIRLSLKKIRQIFWTTLPYLAVTSFFVAFVFINGGIVLGDKSAHKVVLHPMQNLYFLDFAAFFAIPHILVELPNLHRETWLRRLPLLGMLWILFFVVSEFNLLEHPYLLADNRHFSFYLWRRIFGNLPIRRLVTPTYALAAFFLWRLLRKWDLVFIMSLALCIFANLTPQYLFDLRYYIIPFLMLRLHFPQKPSSVWLETLFFTTVNCLVFYIFLGREFRWESQPGMVQRIMW